ncbi:toll/interleukin-1 receptor domain-containing protein [Streptomyces sp. KL118A]|uniref:toll/interleukin-1 receptor domain-containing protein n=1 Tax=Streptomyces sp. KL118A TaxID=3045153 RepID=UPI00278C2B71|nr:toll/interleukin-1 receptor domain-containing protein [Streptomyces sp. KL118A]
MTASKKGKKPSVFLSYSTQDAAAARRLEQMLDLAGIDVWSDRHLRVGDQWQSVITEALEEAEIVLVLISRFSLTSHWVTREWHTALTSSKRVIPVLVGGATASDLPPGLREIQAVDLNEENPQEIRNLTSAIETWSTSPDPSPAQVLDVQEIIEDTVRRTLERLGRDTSEAPTETEVVGDYVFVVISFDPTMDPTFAAIESAARRAGLRAERIKDVKRDFRVTETILQKITSARIVVADLTLERPNVYFELGYARGKGKTVVTLLKKEAPVHVDVRGWNYLEYIDSRPLEEDLVERFKMELHQE